MIMLTTPIKVPGSIGGSTTISYDKMRIRNIMADPVGGSINAEVDLMVSTNPTQPIIEGVLNISTTLTLTIPSLNFFWGLSLPAGSVTTVLGWITTLQNNIEAGLIAEAAAAGVQSAGV